MKNIINPVIKPHTIPLNLIVLAHTKDAAKADREQAAISIHIIELCGKLPETSNKDVSKSISKIRVTLPVISAKIRPLI